MKKQKISSRIESHRKLADNVYDLTLSVPFAAEALPGQFVGLYAPGGDLLLPRPISICDADKEHLRLVYRIAGEGTARFSRMHAGERIGLLGLLGNGFPLARVSGRHVLILGGGIGIPPMRYLMRTLCEEKSCPPASVTAVLGYRDAETFLADEFAALGRTLIATQDGSTGTKGNVLDAAKAHDLQADIIYACGPSPMLGAVKKYAAGKEAYLSLEERMACGVGVCLGCVCTTAQTDAHSLVRNARVCTEGPVFEAGSIVP